MKRDKLLTFLFKNSPVDIFKILNFWKSGTTMPREAILDTDIAIVFHIRYYRLIQEISTERSKGTSSDVLCFKNYVIIKKKEVFSTLIPLVSNTTPSWILFPQNAPAPLDATSDIKTAGAKPTGRSRACGVE